MSGIIIPPKVFSSSSTRRTSTRSCNARHSSSVYAAAFVISTLEYAYSPLEEPVIIAFCPDDTWNNVVLIPYNTFLKYYYSCFINKAVTMKILMNYIHNFGLHSISSDLWQWFANYPSEALSIGHLWGVVRPTMEGS